MSRSLPINVVACCVILAALAYGQDEGIAGNWKYNPELSAPVPQAPPGGERARGAASGGGPPPGGGRGGGRSGMGRRVSEDDMRRMRLVMRRMTEPPASLVIVRDGATVIITDGDGRSVTYVADNRNEKRVTGEGTFTSRSQFDVEVLVIQEDFGGGVKLTTRVAPVVSGTRERLEMILKAAGLPQPPERGGRPPDSAEGGAPRGPIDTATRVYERVER